MSLSSCKPVLIMYPTSDGLTSRYYTPYRRDEMGPCCMRLTVSKALEGDGRWETEPSKIVLLNKDAFGELLMYVAMPGAQVALDWVPLHPPTANDFSELVDMYKTMWEEDSKWEGA